MKHLTIAARLKVMALLPLVILLGICVAAALGLRSEGETIEKLKADSETSRRIGDITTDMYRIQMLLASGVINEDAETTASMVRAADALTTEILRKWNAYIDHSLTPTEKELADRAGAELNRMLDTHMQSALNALRRSDREAARKAVTDEDARTLAMAVREHLEKLQSLQEDGATAMFDESVQRSKLLTFGMAGAFGVAVLLLFFVSFFTSRAIVRPVVAMRKALLQAQTANDLTQRVPTVGRDEVSEMGRAFNSLMDSLQGTLNRVVAGAQEVSTAATQMAATSSQITESTRMQSESAASTAAAVEEVTVSINQVADNTRETRGVSEQACELSTHGERSARAAAEQMVETSASVGHSMALIERLSQRSNDISGIVKVIRDIAEQTNLLALNAAIEAARAGEQGRGFAVVADEVRKLAERTASSTREISGMIQAIQSEVGDAVENLKNNNQQVSQGRSLAEEVAATLARINEGARLTMERINDISSAACEQGTASNDIARNVERIAQMTEENSAAVTQASTTARELESLAARLHAEVSQFKTA